MFSGNLQSPHMMPMTRPMSGAPNNIQPGMRPAPMAPMTPMAAPSAPTRPMMLAAALRGQGTMA